MTFTVSSSFIGNFKLGDNINHNLKILKLLYRSYNATSDEVEMALLRKPIIVLIAAITESLLHDLHRKIRLFTVEGVANLRSNILDYVRGKNISKFEAYIASAKKHNLLDAANSTLYDDLDLLRKMRNRLHIQNTNNDLEPAEFNVFTGARKVLAEKVLEQTLKTMADIYHRGPNFGFVADFNLPWKEHFTSQETNELPVQNEKAA